MEIETISAKCKSLSFFTPTCTGQLHATKVQYTSMYGHDGTLHHVLCICCTEHNQYHETFSCNKDLLCVLSSACSALNFRHIESVLIVLHTLTIICCCQTQDGYSPVYVASWKGHTEVVDQLVQAGADIHLATTKVHVSTYTLSSSVVAVMETNVRLINPQRTCAVRVMVLGLCVCMCVFLSLCVHLFSHYRHQTGS